MPIVAIVEGSPQEGQDPREMYDQLTRELNNGEPLTRTSHWGDGLIAHVYCVGDDGTSIGIDVWQDEASWNRWLEKLMPVAQRARFGRRAADPRFASSQLRDRALERTGRGPAFWRGRSLPVSLDFGYASPSSRLIFSTSWRSRSARRSTASWLRRALLGGAASLSMAPPAGRQQVIQPVLVGLHSVAGQQMVHRQAVPARDGARGARRPSSRRRGSGTRRAEGPPSSPSPKPTSCRRGPIPCVGRPGARRSSRCRRRRAADSGGARRVGRLGIAEQARSGDAGLSSRSAQHYLDISLGVPYAARVQHCTHRCATDVKAKAGHRDRHVMFLAIARHRYRAGSGRRER